MRLKHSIEMMKKCHDYVFQRMDEDFAENQAEWIATLTDWLGGDEEAARRIIQSELDNYS